MPMRVICKVGMGVPLLVASFWQTGVQGSKQQEGWFEGATPLGFFPRSLPVLVLLPIAFDVINPPRTLNLLPLPPMTRTNEKEQTTLFPRAI